MAQGNAYYIARENPIWFWSSLKQEYLSPLHESCFVSTLLLPPLVLPVTYRQLQFSLLLIWRKEVVHRNNPLGAQKQLLRVIHSLDLESSHEPGLDHSLNSPSCPALNLKPCAHILRKLAWHLKEERNKGVMSKSKSMANAKSILGCSFQGTSSVFNSYPSIQVGMTNMDVPLPELRSPKKKKSPQCQSIWLVLNNKQLTSAPQEQPTAADAKANSHDSKFKRHFTK